MERREGKRIYYEKRNEKGKRGDGKMKVEIERNGRANGL